jgi:hypothetical protein
LDSQGREDRMSEGDWREPYVYCSHSSALRALRPLLETWTTLVKRYAEQVEDDIPYWYNERANVSLLAGAAWTRGALALEEYSEEKFSSEEPDGWKGRADLWVLFRGRNYVFEAKHRWPCVDSGEDLDDLDRCVLDALRAARKDAVASSRHGGQRVGIVFVTPTLSRAEEADERIGPFLRRLEEMDLDFLAWAVPPEGKLPASGEIPEHKGQYYPGVALVGRVPRR